MTYCIDEVNKEKIINKFGNDFLIRVDSLIQPFSKKWHIDELNLINSFSASLVFQGHSNLYGPIVMKFGRKPDEFRSEVTALKNFKSQAICQLFEVDYDNMVLLEESIEPGLTLQSEEDINIRLDMFCDLFKQLHPVDVTFNHEKDHSFQYKSYQDWVFNITDYMDKQEAWQEVTIHMKHAKEIFIELSKNNTSENLLHGDFHYYNILKSNDSYTIIDPKGVLGNPIFDVPRYMLNEFWDEEDDSKVDATIEKVFNVISQNLGITKDVLSKLLYVEGTMAICWNIEDGTSLDEKEDILETINWLAKYLK